MTQRETMTKAIRRRLRTPWTLALALVLGIGGWQAWERLGPTDYHEHISGVQGAYPTPLGHDAPAKPARVVRQLRDTAGIIGGLSFHETDDDDRGSRGLVALSLRTGKQYWHYSRDKAHVEKVRIADDTAALWWDDDVLVALDIRTGKPRWHQRVPLYLDTVTDGESDPGLSSTNGRVLAFHRGELTAFHAKSGKRIWTADLPKNCRARGKVSFSVRTAVAISADCPPSSYGDDAVFGIDTDSGAVRWHLPNSHNLFLPLGEGKVFAGHWDSFDQAAVIDLSGTKPKIRTVADPDLGTEGSGETVVGTRDDDKGAERVLRARSTRDGHILWTRKPAKDTRLGGSLVSGGRVYVVEQPQEGRGFTPEPGPARLLILDLTTGDLLHTAPFPKPPLDGDDSQTLMPWTAREGVVAVGWSGMFTSRDPDLTVLGG